MARGRTAGLGLGRSAEDYLEAIHVVALSGQRVRVTGIADSLKVSKPSVVAALASLEKQGLVRHERYGAVELTPRGARAAERVYRRHRVLEEFLGKVLGVRKATAAVEACAIEHVLSPETVRRLEEFVAAVRVEGRAGGEGRDGEPGMRAGKCLARSRKGGRDAR